MMKALHNTEYRGHLAIAIRHWMGVYYRLCFICTVYLGFGVVSSMLGAGVFAFLALFLVL